MVHSHPGKRINGPLPRVGPTEAVHAYQVGDPVECIYPRDVGLNRRTEPDFAEQVIPRPGVLTKKRDPADCRAQLANNQVDQRGLAGPIWTEQAINAGIHREADLVHPDHFAV